jgi:peptide/nickel transport system substrate-binding protein
MPTPLLARWHLLLGLAVVACVAGVEVLPLSAEPRQGIAMHGNPKHAASINHWPYVNPNAPKQGRITLGEVGSFNSLNPLIYKGESVSGVREYVYESLLARSADEPFSLYGLIAETVDMPDDRGSVTFNLRAAARFSDGVPITADDVIFSHALLRDKGWPFMRTAYSKVASVERLGDRAVRFVFAPGADREAPLIMGLMPIVPKHKTDPETFERTTLAPPVGSGPYRVSRVDPGRAVTYSRNPDWWARDLPLARGRYNFDEIKIEYVRDGTALFEAFKSGQIDVRVEDNPTRWLEGYGFPAVLDGRIIKRELATRLPAGMSALVFNARRPPFDDARLRRAMIELYDFEWINRSLFGGLMRRTESFFERSELSSFGRPADAQERTLLAPFQSVVREEIMSGAEALPVSDGRGNGRVLMQAAVKRLTDAGYVLKDGRIVDPRTVKPLTFEVLTQSRGQERLIQSYAKVLAQIGISLSIRQVDSAQYEARIKEHAFDMIQTTWDQSLSPGAEQLNRWGSDAADRSFTRNYAGIKSPAADAMIAAMVAARTRAELVSSVRALDRVLRSGDYVIPLHHLPKVWVAHWAHLAGPDGPLDTATNAGFSLDTWWSTRP